MDAIYRSKGGGGSSFLCGERGGGDRLSRFAMKTTVTPMAAPSSACVGAGVVQRSSAPAPAALLVHCVPPALGRTSRSVEVGKVVRSGHLDLHSGAVEVSKVVRSGRTARCLDPYFKAANVNAAAQHLPCTFPAPSQHLPFLVPPANMPPMDKCSDKTTATGGFCSGGSGDDCLGGSVYDCFRPKMLTSSEIDADLRSLGSDGGGGRGGSYSAVREASGGKRSLGGSAVAADGDGRELQQCEPDL